MPARASSVLAKSGKVHTLLQHTSLVSRDLRINNKDQMEKFEKQLRTRSGIRLFFMMFLHISTLLPPGSEMAVVQRSVAVL